MKKIIRILTAALFVFIVSCSSGSSPQDQLREIDEMLNKGFPIAPEQQENVDAFIAEGKGLLEQGKKKESSEAFAKALAILELARDAYIFNKAD